MSDIKIEVTNESKTLTDSQVSAAVPALQTQVHDHFAPVWGVDADLSFVASSALSDDAWWLVVLDDSDQAGALGYHDLTANYLPIGKVFAGTDRTYGENWTVTTSHELLEMLGDPEINLVVFNQPNAGSGTLYAMEVCDACEADEYAYPIGGTQVSDFVYPAWFQPSRTAATTRFDYRDQIKQPLQLLSGGYIGVFDVTAGTGWSQQTAEVSAAYATRARVGSRRERRRTPRDQWLPSVRRA
ncbi:hypothetical protein LN042_03765 [Kitasatospora sp. RB6PN24]|uniref:hypothetical protein n=1 Tax=Kitasatospora humi TaxID=2893891 RepID=UPI001E35EF98|nr:hypothetical protein [Kitasatospora humi]MCC9306234.1 hypothetical protein [Kitasatospora humi]